MEGCEGRSQAATPCLATRSGLSSLAKPESSSWRLRQPTGNKSIGRSIDCSTG